MAKYTATGLIHSKERMYIVDSGASSHMMGLSCLNHREKETIRQASKILENQTASGIVVSDTQTRAHIMELGAYTFGQRFTVSYRWKTV